MLGGVVSIVEASRGSSSQKVDSGSIEINSSEVQYLLSYIQVPDQSLRMLRPFFFSPKNKQKHTSSLVLSDKMFLLLTECCILKK